MAPVDEMHIKEMISVSLDACIFPYIKFLNAQIWFPLINHTLLIFRLPAPCCKFLYSLAPFSTSSKTVISGLQDSHQRNLSIFRPLIFSQQFLHLEPQLFSSVQQLSHVQLLVTPWTAVSQASLSITNSQGLTQTHVL